MLKTKNIDSDQVLKRTKRITDYLSTKTRHFLESSKDRTKNIVKNTNLSIKSAREVWKKEGLSVLRPNINVSQATQHIKKLAEGSVAGQKLLKLSQHKWFRRSVIGVAAAVGLSLLEKGMNSFNPQPAIPKSYERGYDIMNETMTDFGSPIKLSKTTSKIITPYYSSSRRSVTTTTNSVTNRNLSLALSNKAISHTRY